MHSNPLGKNVLYPKKDLMITDALIQACRRNQRDAQREVYDLLGPMLYRSCRRYLKQQEEIEEVMADTFYSIFTRMDQLREDYAFEAWCRQIAVNYCLQRLKKQVNFNIYIEDSGTEPLHGSRSDAGVQEEDLLKLLDYLPQGARTVFTLHAIDGYNHTEIAKQLGISTGTSKSQLKMARMRLQLLVDKHYYRQAK